MGGLAIVRAGCYFTMLWGKVWAWRRSGGEGLPGTARSCPLMPPAPPYGPPRAACIRKAELIEAELAARCRAAARAWRGSDLPTDVEQALRCVHAHLFDERLSVTFVRETCGLLNHNISCRFKQAVGVGMRRYIERERMRAAERLLRHSELGVMDIAWSIGYAYPETFGRAFRRYEGCTPTAFRRRAGKTRG